MAAAGINCAIQAGELRHRVTIQQYTESRNSAGEVIRSWTNEKQVWAGIEALTGSQRQEAMQQNADVTHRIKMRYNSTLTSEKRIVWDGRTFELKTPVSDDLKRLTEVDAVEQVS